MSSALYLINQTFKALKKIDMTTYISFLILLFINIYGLYPSILGKITNVLLVLYLILDNNLTFGLIAFLMIILLNNKTVENFENNLDETTKNSTEENQTDVETKTETEINDPVASFKSKYCKNGKLVDENNNPVNISDLSTVFPHIKFNLENQQCNPCEDNCDFKLTSETERISVEEKLRPTDSSQVSAE